MAETVLSISLTSNASASNQNSRQVFKASALSDVTGYNQIRLTFHFLGGEAGYTIGTCYIGQKGATEPNFTGDQVQVKFNNGNSTFSTPGSASDVVSDWVTLAQNFDGTVDYVISWFVGFVPGNEGSCLDYTSGCDFWSEGSTGVDHSSETVPTGTYSETGGLAVSITKLEVQTSGVTVTAAPIVIVALAIGEPELDTPHKTFDPVGLAISQLYIGVPAFSTPKVLLLGDRVLDYGLNVLDSECDRIHVCAGVPETWDEVGSKTLGYKSFSTGAAFGAVGPGDPGGRLISSVAITDGDINANGTVSHWAAVDNANSRLLASGKLSGGKAVSSGSKFSLEAIPIHMDGELT